MSRKDQKNWDLVALLSVVGFVFELVRVAVDALIKRNGTVDDLRRLLKEPDLVDKVFDLIVVKPVAVVATVPAAAVAKILNLFGNVRVPFIGQFVVAEHFVINTSSSAVAKVSYLSDNFKEWLLTKVEGVAGDVTLSYHQLTKNSLDTPIIAELGGKDKVETTLAAVWYLMRQQKNGESGVLLTNGYANIFYVLDANGVLRAVGVFWRDGGWHVNAFSVEYPLEWHAGRRVFSRNS